MSDGVQESLLEGEESQDDPLMVVNLQSPVESQHLVESRRFFPTMATKAWVTVAILTCVNLVNYMDRFSVAGSGGDS